MTDAGKLAEIRAVLDPGRGHNTRLTHTEAEWLLAQYDALRERLRAALVILRQHSGYMFVHNMLGMDWVRVLDDPDNATLLNEEPTS